MAPGQKYLSVRFREKNSNYFNTHNFFSAQDTKIIRRGRQFHGTPQSNLLSREEAGCPEFISPQNNLLSHLRTNPSLRGSSATLIASHQIGKRCTIPKSDQSSGPVSSSSKQNNQRSRRGGWWLTAIRDPRKP
jgi:hypothetical protein